MERLCRLLDGCPAEETIQGELRDNRKIFVLSGTWSTRTYLKRMNQIIAARLVHELEFLCAWEQNASRSEALRRRLWKDFLVNQAHDSICGCSVDEVHREMMSRYARIAQSIGEQTESVLERQYPFVYGEPGAKNHWLHVINSLPYPGRRLVKARILLPLDQDKGGVALWQGERPVPLSRAERRVQEEFFHNSLTQPWYEDMAVYELEFFLDFAGMEEICLRIEPTEPQTTAVEQGSPAENRFYRLEIRDGQLCVLEKSTGTWHTGQNVYRSSLDEGDTYNYSPPEQDACAEAHVVAWRTESRPGQRTLHTESVLELPEGLAPDRKGPAEHTMTLTIHTEYTLYEEDPVIHVRTRLDNRARDHRLTADFEVPGCESHCSDTAFDWVERPVNGSVDPQVGPGQEVIPGQHPTGTQLVAGELQLVHLGQGVCPAGGLGMEGHQSLAFIQFRKNRLKQRVSHINALGIRGQRKAPCIKNIHGVSNFRNSVFNFWNRQRGKKSEFVRIFFYALRHKFVAFPNKLSVYLSCAEIDVWG